MPARIYFDHNATTPMLPCAKEALINALDTYGNPSSVHQTGQAARLQLEQARQKLAQVTGVRPAQIVFTSGGTESNNLALQGLKKHVNAILVGAGEHPSVLQASRQAHQIALTPQGHLCLSSLEAWLKQIPAPVLVSVALANNETGIVEDVQSIAALVHRYGGLIHTDAIQAWGRICVDWNKLQVDMMTLSSHKIGGGAGIGLLVIKEGLPFHPLMRGGGQERGWRSGTPNVPLALSFAAAAQATVGQNMYTNHHRWHEQLETALLKSCPQAQVIGRGQERLPNTTAIGLPGILAETQVMALDLKGIAVSAGAACSSGKVSASHVLQAMNADPALALGTIRISSGWTTQEQDFQHLENAWCSLLPLHGITS